MADRLPAQPPRNLDAGGRPANSDTRSHWWVWSRDVQHIQAGRVSGDFVERGPAHWRLFERDARLARRGLGANGFRLSIKWSRVFPRSSAGARTPRQRAARPRAGARAHAQPLHAAQLAARPDRGARCVRRPEPGRRAPQVAVNGYVNLPGTLAGWFPPGVFSFTAAIRVVRNLARANAVAYDAVHRHDPGARVGPVAARGYFGWSLMDNFEWAAGYYPRFGYFSYDPRTLARRAHPSARVFRRIARTGQLPRPVRNVIRAGRIGETGGTTLD